MTRDALKFNKKADWWTVLTNQKNDGIPTALTLSADGDVAYVSTAKISSSKITSKLYRIEGISNAVTKDLAEGREAVTGVDGTDSIAEVKCVITSTEISDSLFNTRAITSIAIDPQDNNRVIITLGNYGNDDYVFYAEDGKTFTSVQNNLPKVPVYSSLIENTTGLVMIGTEKGIYTSEDLTNWTADNTVGNIPVMEIKQQLLENHDPRYVYLVDEVGDITTIEFPTIKNQNVVYIATYGRGLYKCENFVQKEGESIVENTTSATALEMSIYPNPVVSEATIKFNVEATATVSYQIYDLSGRMVQNATLGNYGQGSHSVNFNVDGLSNGTYIVKVQAGTITNTAKILVYSSSTT